jgi:hypothetical protein
MGWRLLRRREIIQGDLLIASTAVVAALVQRF